MVFNSQTTEIFIKSVVKTTGALVVFGIVGILHQVYVYYVTPMETIDEEAKKCRGQKKESDFHLHLDENHTNKYKKIFDDLEVTTKLY